MDNCLASVGRHTVQTIAGPTCQIHLWLARGEIAHGHVFPGDAHGKPGAERFGARLFRRPTLCVGSRNVLACVGLGLLDRGENAGLEARSELLQRAFDTVDVCQITADAKYHESCASTCPLA